MIYVCVLKKRQIILSKKTIPEKSFRVIYKYFYLTSVYSVQKKYVAGKNDLLPKD